MAGALVVDKRTNVSENLFKHGFGQPTRIGVVARAMIAVEHGDVVDMMAGAMRERILAQLTSKSPYGAVMRDLAQA